MKAKHTEGPWTVGQVRNTGIYDIIGADVTGKGREIVGDFRASQSRDVNDSNAALIAAAPELLQAVQDFILLADLHDWEGAAIDNARAAIKKAEGNQ